MSNVAENVKVNPEQPVQSRWKMVRTGMVFDLQANEKITNLQFVMMLYYHMRLAGHDLEYIKTYIGVNAETCVRKFRTETREHFKLIL